MGIILSDWDDTFCDQAIHFKAPKSITFAYRFYLQPRSLFFPLRDMTRRSLLHSLTSKTLSAGGQEEHPSDVNSSTTASFALDGVALTLDNSRKVTSPIFSAAVLSLLTTCVPQKLIQHQIYIQVSDVLLALSPSPRRTPTQISSASSRQKPIPLLAQQQKEQVYLLLSLTLVLSFE